MISFLINISQKTIIGNLCSLTKMCAKNDYIAIRYNESRDQVFRNESAMSDFFFLPQDLATDGLDGMTRRMNSTRTDRWTPRAPLLAARSDVPCCFARNLSMTAMWAGLSRAWVGLEPSPAVVILWRGFTGVLPLLALSPFCLCSLSSLSAAIWVARSVAADLPPHLP
jgi:hypothetical protein